MRAIGLLLAALVTQAPGLPCQQMRYAMGTVWTIEAAGERCDVAIAAAFTEIRRLDALLSTYRPESELSRLNRTAAAGWVALTPETAGLIDRALAYARESAGAFDPTVAPLVGLWGFKHLDYHLPPAAAIAAARARVGFRLVQRRAGAIRFTRAGVALDLGAIAKGYAVDRALAVLRAGGATAGRVDAGGNQGVFGDMAAVGPPWVGIKHPRVAGEVLGAVSLPSGGISTSGDAERGFWERGVRFGHVIDPRTGWPVAGRLAVTVVARGAEEADALSTTLYVLGPRAGRSVLARHAGAAALYVEADGSVITTPGLHFREAR